MSQAHRNATWNAYARRARKILAANQAPCAACPRPINWELDGRTRWGGTVAHPHALALGGELTPPIDTLVAMHRVCAAREGATITNHLRRHGKPARNRAPRQCVRCGCTYTPGEPNQQYCSMQCAVRARQRPTWTITWTAQCAICQNPMSRTTTTHNDPDATAPSPPNRHTCGTQCSQKLSGIHAGIRARDTYRARTGTPGGRSSHPETAPSASWSWSVTAEPTEGTTCDHPPLNAPAMHSKNDPPFSRPFPNTPPQPSGFVYDDLHERTIPRVLTENLRTPGENDALPLHFSEPHPEAVGSRGDEMVRFAEDRRKGPLRWFQWLCAQRRYEVRADGSWCWPLALETLARQLGKTVDLCEDAAWIGSLPRDDPAWAGAFDDDDIGLILHAANRVALSRKVQAKLWNWAEAQGFEVYHQLGDSRITWPHGTLWQTVAMASSYGSGPARLLVDETWAMDPTEFWNAMWPAMGARGNPVALFFSAAHAKDKGLVADLRSDPDVCRMEWAAHPDEDFTSERVWRAATPWMSAARLRQMRIASRKPGFAEQWLNVWPAAVGGGVPWADPAVWRPCADSALPEVGSRPVVGVGLDRVAGVWPVVAAWRDADGRVLLRLVTRAGSKDEAVSAAKVLRPGTLMLPRVLRGQVTVPGARETVHAHGGDVVAARELTGWMVGQGQLRVDPGALDAVLASPLRREGDRVDAGTLCVLAAWWAGRDKPKSVVV